MGKFTAILLIMIAGIMYSCQKEISIDTLNNPPGGGSGSGSGGGGTTGNTEVGNWKFLEMHVITSGITEITGGGINFKTINNSDYITLQNQGTINFTGTKMTSSNIAYTVNSTVKVYAYENNSLIDSLEVPFAATLPPSNSSADYQKIGTDSLYFQSGVIGTVNSDGTIESLPGGYKLKFSGDTMTMTLHYSDIQTETDQGITQKITNKATSVSTLLRQ